MAKERRPYCRLFVIGPAAEEGTVLQVSSAVSTGVARRSTGVVRRFYRCRAPFYRLSSTVLQVSSAVSTGVVWHPTDVVRRSRGVAPAPARRCVSADEAAEVPGRCPGRTYSGLTNLIVSRLWKAGGRGFRGGRGCRAAGARDRSGVVGGGGWLRRGRRVWQ